MTIHLNGHARTLAELSSPVPISDVIETLGLQSDRIAVEHNGVIVSRTVWAQVQVTEGDRLEIVQFVGGGSHTPVTPK